MWMFEQDRFEDLKSDSWFLPVSSTEVCGREKNGACGNERWRWGRLLRMFHPLGTGSRQIKKKDHYYE